MVSARITTGNNATFKCSSLGDFNTRTVNKYDRFKESKQHTEAPRAKQKQGVLNVS